MTVGRGMFEVDDSDRVLSEQLEDESYRIFGVLRIVAFQTRQGRHQGLRQPNHLDSGWGVLIGQVLA